MCCAKGAFSWGPTRNMCVTRALPDTLVLAQPECYLHSVAFTLPDSLSTKKSASRPFVMRILLQRFRFGLASKAWSPSSQSLPVRS